MELVYLRYQADDRANHRSFHNFSKIPRNFVAVSKFCWKGQIRQLGS